MLYDYSSAQRFEPDEKTGNNQREQKGKNVEGIIGCPDSRDVWPERSDSSHYQKVDTDEIERDQNRRVLGLQMLIREFFPSKNSYNTENRSDPEDLGSSAHSQV